MVKSRKKSITSTWRSIIGRVVIWTAFSVLLYTNIISYKHLSPLFQNEHKQLMTSYTDANAHIDLARKYWKIGFETHAKREISLAQQVFTQNNENVLSASDEPTTIYTSWTTMPHTLEEQFEFWMQLTTTYPGYPDAFIQTGTAAYQLGNDTDATEALQHAHTQDPTIEDDILSLIDEL